MEWLIKEKKRKAERLKKENEVTINIVSEDTFIPVDEWSKLQELNKQDEIPQEGDTFIRQRHGLSFKSLINKMRILLKKKFPITSARTSPCLVLKFRAIFFCLSIPSSR